MTGTGWPAKVLVIDLWAPAPDRDAASLRMFNLLELLASGGSRIGFAERAERPTADWPVGLPRRGVSLASGRLEELLEDGDGYDAVLVSRSAATPALFGAVREGAPRARLIYDTVDLPYVWHYRRAKHLGNEALLRRALALKAETRGLVERAHATLVVSEVERRELLELCPAASVHVVSTIHRPIAAPPAFARREGAVFVGNFSYEPNADALDHLASDLWPRVRAMEPALELRLVGSFAPESSGDWERAGMVVVGHVPDLGPELDRARLSVAPLRFGAGVKGKVLSSLSRGLPVVGTPVAFEGIPVEHEREVLVAEEPAALAREIARLHRDASLWERLSQAGLAVIAEHFAPAAARAGLAAALGAEPDQTSAANRRAGSLA